MEPELASFLAHHSPASEGHALWGGGTIPLRITGYLSDEEPPVEYVTSVRCVLLRDDMVLLQRDRDSTHILPGGRREPGETLEETLGREVPEETGWTVLSPVLIGFLRYQHLGPKPEGWTYLYPDFLQAVYAARAGEYRPDAKLDDGYELESTFLPVAEVQSLQLTPGESLYLNAALDRLAP